MQVKFEDRVGYLPVKCFYPRVNGNLLIRKFFFSLRRIKLKCMIMVQVWCVLVTEESGVVCAGD